ncbi:MAG: DUF4847 domain-containing protein [Bacteroidaceae bacterium]|nr:DUF4847 domain-containing protein [Bacteroidaceae bacterium]
MKKYISYLAVALIALLLLPTMSGCHKEDDAKTIFTGKVWKLSYIFREGNSKAHVNFWLDDREAEARSIEIQRKNGNYEFEFIGASIDGYFSGTIAGKVVESNFSGTWRTNTETRLLNISDLKWTTEETDILAVQFQKGLSRAYKYSGDANALYIYYKCPDNDEITYVMALYPKNQ